MPVEFGKRLHKENLQSTVFLESIIKRMETKCQIIFYNFLKILNHLKQRVIINKNRQSTKFF
jgi:hypothetical protein